MKLDTLNKLYIEELRDVYNAENQLLKALPKMAKGASSAELKKAFPSAMPPRTPVKDHAGLLAIIARIELSAGKLM